MYLIDGYYGDSVRVVDTNDAVAEIMPVLTVKAISKSKGIDILAYDKSIIVQSVISYLNKKFISKMNRNRDEIVEYIAGHSIPAISEVCNIYKTGIDFSRRIKFYDYLETQGFSVIELTLLNGLLVFLYASCYSDYDMYYDAIHYLVIDFNDLLLGQSRIAGGRYFLNNIKGNFRLNLEDIYIFLMSKDNLPFGFVSVDDIQDTVLSKVSFVPYKS